MPFGSGVVDLLTADLTDATLIPCSKSGARNEAALSAFKTYILGGTLGSAAYQPTSAFDAAGAAAAALATALAATADRTGTGDKFVMATAPTVAGTTTLRFLKVDYDSSFAVFGYQITQATGATPLVQMTANANTGEVIMGSVVPGGYYLSIYSGGMARIVFNSAGDPVFASQIVAAASTPSKASLNVPVGPAPTAPVDGDIWREDNTNTGLKIRINGVTKTINLS